MNADKRLLLISAICLFAVAALFLIGPIQQDSNYHLFADSRTLLNIPHFFNVVSSLPLFIVGLLGVCLFSRKRTGIETLTLDKTYLLFFIGVLLTGLGSSYYHTNPNNATLLWDRLPMTISFMALFCAVMSECISAKWANCSLPWLVLLGLASVCYWYFSESRGQGDLRAYLLVQFLPIALIPLIMWLYNGNQKGCQYVWPVLGAYFLAKIAESLDVQLYQALFISGHTIKHLLAGLGCYFVYRAIKKRRSAFNL